MVAIRGTFLPYLVQYTQNISLADVGGIRVLKQDKGKVIEAKYP